MFFGGEAWWEVSTNPEALGGAGKAEGGGTGRARAEPGLAEPQSQWPGALDLVEVAAAATVSAGPVAPMLGWVFPS